MTADMTSGPWYHLRCLMRAQLLPILRRIVKVGVAVLLALVLVGATYQGVATSLERRDAERPGRLVDVGGYQLHIHCVGEGSPTVVLEAAAGGMSAAWGWVQPELSTVTRVCSYDRAMLGWSEGGADGFSTSRIPEELRTLLANANERGPFVLVGHELGATFVRDFAARFGSETAAVVLVEESGRPRGRASVRAWPWLARVGLLRAAGTPSSLSAGLLGESGVAMRVFLNRPDHLTRAALELSSAAEAEAESRSRRRDASIALTTVTTASRGLPALLSTPEQAEPVIRAARSALVRVRAERAAKAALTAP